MSSTYRILCLGHDPAFTFGEYDRPEEAVAAIASGISEHPDCDLLIGQYSYPLVAVACPPRIGLIREGQHNCYLHPTPEWVDVAWLRLLALAHRSNDGQVRKLLNDPILRCWPADRLHRLRIQLGMEENSA